MKKYWLEQLNRADLDKLCRRNAVDFDAVLPIVRKIVQEVKANGDEAVAKFTAQFDGVVDYAPVVTQTEIDQASARITTEVQQAFEAAAQNVHTFHRAQLTKRITVQTMPGVTCFSEARPIEKVGLYVPGGVTPLPSTVMMLAIPAVLAGCSEIVLVTPPSKDGSVADVILFVAKMCGIKQIVKIGGAQAIAALAFGTETVPKVDKIYGPGNQFVTTAKMLVSTDIDGAAIDMPAGPTELLVVADEAARADFVAGDLLSQAEHSTDAQTVLIATTEAKANEVEQALNYQLQDLPRQQIAQQALKNTFALIVNSVDDALVFVNRYAPEHLILNVKNSTDYVPAINNAGSVFLGEYACEAAGDYASGPNHSLPTYGYARVYGGVSVSSFQKQVTFQSVSQQGARNINPIVQVLATQEALEGHRRVMQLRAM